MRARLSRSRRLAVGALAAFVAGAACLSQQAYGQFVFAPYRLVDSFENAADVTNYVWTGDAVISTDPTAGTGANAQVSNGATRGNSAMQVQTEGAFDLDDGEFVSGWGAIGGVVVQGSYTAGPAFDAFQLAAQNPDAWELAFDVSSDAASWAEAPDTATSTAIPGDVGPERSGSRVQLTYDSIPGTTFNTGSIYGTTGKLTVRVPFKALYDGSNPAPTTGAANWQLAFGADQNRFAPDDPAPNGGAKHYIDNIRLKPRAPQTYEVLYDFEGAGAAAFDGWSDLGRSGSDTNHKHSIIGGNVGSGATQYNAANNNFLPTATGQALLIDTSNIAPGVNGFQWASVRTYNADTDNNGVVDNAGVKAEITQLISKLRKATAFQVDATYHNPTDVPGFVSTPIIGPQGGGTVPFVAGEAGGPWLKLVLGVEMDSTPENGPFMPTGPPNVPNGLVGNQLDNELATDALGNAVLTSRTDYAAILQSEPIPGSLGEEPLTFNFGFAQIGSFISQLNSAVATNTNFFRLTFAVQTGNGDSTILMALDNFRIVTSVSLDGDYDHDGDVDGADIAPWAASLGSTTNFAADGDENGIVDGADILLWQRNAGNDATPGSFAAVPEPAAGLLALFGLAALGVRRRS